MEQKKVFRKYEDSDKIEETTLEVAIEKLEEREYYKRGTVKDLLEAGQVVWNPFCQYAIKKELLKL